MQKIQKLAEVPQKQGPYHGTNGNMINPALCASICVWKFCSGKYRYAAAPAVQAKMLILNGQNAWIDLLFLKSYCVLSV